MPRQAGSCLSYQTLPTQTLNRSPKEHAVEYGINREILKIDALALFEIILANVEQAEARFKEIVQAHIETKAKQQEVLDKTLTLRQKINRLGQEVSTNEGAVSLLSAAAALLVPLR